MSNPSVGKPRITVETVFFASLEGLSEEDAENARSVNRANLRLGLVEFRPLPITRAVELPSDEAWIDIRRAISEWLIDGLAITSVEAYPDHNVNVFIRLRSQPMSKPIGFLRVRVKTKGGKK